MLTIRTDTFNKGRMELRKRGEANLPKNTRTNSLIIIIFLITHSVRESHLHAKCNILHA